MPRNKSHAIGCFEWIFLLAALIVCAAAVMSFFAALFGVAYLIEGF